MAIISMSFDTVKKTMSVNIDGKPVDNVMEVNAYQYGENDCTCSVRQREEMSDDGMIKYTTVLASDSKEARAKANVAVPSKKFPGFVTIPSKSKLEDDIAKFFGI